MEAGRAGGAVEDVLKVGELAEKAGLTVRTLHHYDEIGLLVPSRRSASGYRLYDEADLQRLRDILLFRQLGLSLEAIRQLLEDPTVDRRQALTAHRAALLR
ncbi:MAG TPA: MerR family transcriptional regulator, partial [Bacteroidia bacterium]|nr:MerR family transcriptional regulator [Bacteroidia bacterium]